MAVITSFLRLLFFGFKQQNPNKVNNSSLTNLGQSDRFPELSLKRKGFDHSHFTANTNMIHCHWTVYQIWVFTFSED